MKSVARNRVKGDKNRWLRSHHRFRQGGKARVVRRNMELEAERLSLGLPESSQLIIEGLEHRFFRSERDRQEGDTRHVSGLRQFWHDRLRESNSEEHERDRAPSHSITSSAQAISRK
jgi:hypothetical protein